VGAGRKRQIQPAKLRGYDNITKVLRNVQSGLVLGNPGEQIIFQVAPPVALCQGLFYFCNEKVIKIAR